LCSLASFKLSSLGAHHPSCIPLLNCYSTKHSRRHSFPDVNCADIALCSTHDLTRYRIFLQLLYKLLRGSHGRNQVGDTGTLPPTFSESGDIICHVLIFLLRIRNILVLHQTAPLTFCNKIPLVVVPLVCSKTIVELVQATDHAGKTGYQLLIPLYCNQWGKARGSPEPILICCLPG